MIDSSWFIVHSSSKEKNNKMVSSEWLSGKVISDKW